MVRVTRTSHHLRPDPSRLVLRPFLPGSSTFGGGSRRLENLVKRALELPEPQMIRILDELRDRHGEKFPDLEEAWSRHYEFAANFVDDLVVTDEDRRLFIGSLLTQTYAYESSALTNPSIVPLDAVTNGEQRFVMSARAIGEGHISSIAFFTGSVDESGQITLDERYPTVSNGRRCAPQYSRKAFTNKLRELGFLTPAAEKILNLLPETFTSSELAKAADKAMDSDLEPLSIEDAVKRVHWLAESNYQLDFDPSLPLSQHVISPAAPVESQGMEDARFVRFADDDGSVTYYGTYTAYDGVRILPQLIQTVDFNSFRMLTLAGPAINHKGMALFPRKIRGEYVALSRHDHERSFVLRSDDVRSWSNAEIVFGPQTEWDLVQTGNCGSPIETDAGWLVITHGVGPMRRYVLGAILLDLDEPSKVLARLPEPLIEPQEDERFGYVPDVVYSCGSLVHSGNLITPFGYADHAIKIAVTPLDDILDSMS